MNDVMNLLKSHKSIRKFTDQQVDDATVNEIVRCAQSAASSNFIQAYTIIRVVSPEKRAQIAAVAGGQQWVVDCPLFLMFCADLKRAGTACDMQGKTLDAGCTEGFIVATVDAALAAQNAITAAESLGMGGVFIGGIRNNPAEICKILDIPHNVYPLFGMCLGYPAADPGQKERLPLDAILKTDSYGSGSDMDSLKAYDVRINEYYRSRDCSKRDDTWTGQISTMMGKPQRLHMKEFLERQGFLLK
ncbi:MAG: oxygen-insensitive NADPH nitroreductase [Christensenellales bacterium]